ncbi:hypothetical protein BCR35DRAFT_352618 [Leucosporidium creatinivorum]|uniref:DUF7918 domain-containing protein n=1 Tax=Leucosporidium creatinivorum TaxID=106004 RepID=A0A1Y2F748_9BASI|nr:hypothetical protein BCR35DRAFT_352618 [Leucosporidium creatinivorum]
MAQQDPPTKLTSPLLPGCEAWITVDEKPLSVYSAGFKGNKSFGYVEAVEGARFEVKYRDGRVVHPSEDFCVKAFLDGRPVRGKVFYNTDPLFTSAPDSDERLAVYSSARVTYTSERPFFFSKLAQTDDDELSCKDEKVVKHIGTIQLRYVRVKNVRNSEGKSKKEYSDIVLHERTKKAKLSHQTSLGPVQTHAATGALTYTSIDSADNPCCTFEFRYRSRALLELEGHAPALPAPAVAPNVLAAQNPPPSAPKPLATPKKAEKEKKRPLEITIDSDDEEDGMTELERLRARVAELEAERERVKVEPGVKVKEEKESSLKKVKTEKGALSGGDSSSTGDGKKLEMVELD